MVALEHDSQFFTRRGAVLVLIIALHIFIFWALATGLARKAIEVLAPPIQTDIVQEEQKKVEPPPPPPPTFEKPPVEVPPPDVTVDLPVEPTQTTAITNVTTKHVEAPPPVAKAAPSTPPKGKFGPTDGYYPEASRRLGEEGTATVHVCVGANGKQTAAPTILQSSGKERLDQGAINYAKDTRFAPAVAEGKPVDACIDFRVKFTLH
jgi:periplasmic protein TonB